MPKILTLDTVRDAMSDETLGHWLELGGMVQDKFGRSCVSLSLATDAQLSRLRTVEPSLTTKDMQELIYAVTSDHGMARDAVVYKTLAKALAHYEEIQRQFAVEMAKQALGVTQEE